METRVLMRMAIALMAVLVLASAGVRTADDPGFQPIAWADEVSGKNFPLFAIIDADDAAGKAIASSPGLRTVLEAKREALDRAASACAFDAACHVAALAWSADDVTRVSDALRVLARSGALASAIDRMRQSGLFARDAELGDEAFIVRAWERAAGGLNRILAVYGRGEPPRYPASTRSRTTRPRPTTDGSCTRPSVSCTSGPMRGNGSMSPRARWRCACWA